jgi:hypothetical protein
MAGARVSVIVAGIFNSGPGADAAGGTNSFRDAGIRGYLVARARIFPLGQE